MAITGNQKAYKFALSGVARSGATRSGYVSSRIFINIDGVESAFRVEQTSLVITDELDETPSRCAFRIIGGATTTGTPVTITLGSSRGAKLFAGFVVDTSFSYWQRTDRTQNYFCDVNCLDYTWLFGFTKVTRRYTNASATDIAKDLVANYAAMNGFTANNVVANLPALAEITYTNEDLTDAMTRLARRIGAYWYVDYDKDVHLFFEEAGNGAPADLTPTHPSLSHVVKAVDRSQTLTRVYVEGRGSTLLSDVALGDTMLPLEAVDMFSPVSSDVFLKASFQGADGGAQHLTYTGVVTGGDGTLIGPGIGPATAPTLNVQAGAGVDTGTHRYAVTFVTATGESLPSPTATITTGIVPNPTAAPGPVTQAAQGFNGSFIAIGHSITFIYTYGTTTASTSSPQTLPSAVSTPIVTVSNNDPLNPAHSAPLEVGVPFSTDARVKYIFVWVRDPATTGATFVSYGNVIANNPAGGTFYLGGSGSNIFPANPVAPSSNTTSSNQINVTAIPVGAATVTQRKLYRTAAGAAQLKLLTTIANNTATTYLDTLADASLGANVPTSDTSGLPQPAGQILPGANTLPVAGTGPFELTGGWAIIGNGEQVIRYTNLLVTGSLVGIPTSGIGSITATIVYNSTVTAAPMLTGIPAAGLRGITARPLTKGDEIYLVVQVDDPARQAAFVADLGGTGIREEWDQDRRLSIAEARHRGTALLQLRELDQHRLSYTCRDLRTAAGKTVFCNLPTMSISYHKIQSVRIDNFRPHPTQYPTFTVEASTSRYSFEDLLRQAKSKE